MKKATPKKTSTRRYTKISKDDRDKILHLFRFTEDNNSQTIADTLGLSLGSVDYIITKWLKNVRSGLK